MTAAPTPGPSPKTAGGGESPEVEALSRSSIGWLWHAVRHPLVIALLFSALAAVVRWPYLHLIPRYTDESGEIATAMAIAFEGARPLVHNDAYRGPLWAYLLGAVLSITGPDPDIPRLFALAIGSLTVGAVYLLGRTLAGGTAGAVAALLMTTAFAPVALSSHVPWSNNSTPLFVALATLALYRSAGSPPATSSPAPSGGGGGAKRRGWGSTPEDRWLILAAILWSLALHTHPSVLALLPGAALWFVAAPERRRRLGTPGPWIAAAAFVITLAPIIVYNIQQRSPAYVEDAFNPSQPIAEDRSPAAFAANVVALAGQVGRTAGAGPPQEAEDRHSSSIIASTDAFRPVATLAYALALLGAPVVAAVRGPRLPAAMAASAVIVMPLVNRGYQSFHDMRYVVILFPLAYAAMGAIVAERASDAPPGRPRRWLLASVAALALYPLVALGAYYAREAGDDRTNASIRGAIAWLATNAAGPRDVILVDKAMRDIKLGGGGNVTRAVDQGLRLSGLDPIQADIDEIRWHVVEDTASTVWVVGADATVGQLRSEQGDAIEAVDVGAGVVRGPIGWRVALRAAGLPGE